MQVMGITAAVFLPDLCVMSYGDVPCCDVLRMILVQVMGTAAAVFPSVCCVVSPCVVRCWNLLCCLVWCCVEDGL